MFFRKLGMDLLGSGQKKYALIVFLLKFSLSNDCLYFRELQGSGYKIKNQFKRMNEPFSILVNPGDVTSIVLKKIPNLNNYVWPPKGIEIFR